MVHGIIEDSNDQRLSYPSNMGSLWESGSHQAQASLFELHRMQQVDQFSTINFIWLVVWNMNFIYPYIGNVIIPTVTHSIIFQRGREKPPTSYVINHH